MKHVTLGKLDVSRIGLRLSRTVAYMSGTGIGGGVLTPSSVMTGSWGMTSGIFRTFQLARCEAANASRAVIVCPTDWPSRCQASAWELAKEATPLVMSSSWAMVENLS